MHRAPFAGWMAFPGPTPVPDAVPTSAPGPAAPYDLKGQRPLGVTLLALLSALLGLGMVLGGLIVATVGAAFAFFPFFGGLGAAFAAVLGFVALLFGLLFLVIAWGHWTGQAWSWTLALILVLLGILSAVLNLLQGEVVGSLVNLLLNLFLLWYLTRDGVQRWFGKQGAWPAPQVNALLDRTGSR